MKKHNFKRLLQSKWIGSGGGGKVIFHTLALKIEVKYDAMPVNQLQPVLVALLISLDN